MTAARAAEISQREKMSSGESMFLATSWIGEGGPNVLGRVEDRAAVVGGRLKLLLRPAFLTIPK